MIQNYQLGLLFLVKLLIDADGVADEMELKALHAIKSSENIPDQIFWDFERRVAPMRERDVYSAGIYELNQCSLDEKLNIFSILYKLSEVDGRVHLKEIKLLLYSIRTAGLEFDQVVTHAKSTPALMV